ncbi:MAG: aldo/keto reductase [Ruminococcaceae bacterium]|nr:aldo/keto reductase [Oscillospiraceae bacterium]
MQYREFKKLGIKVSAFGLGCMRFPTIEIDGEKKVDIENAKNIVRRAIDGGVNYVDTAYNYSNKTNEIVVGEALADGYRDKVFLATKLPSFLCEKPEDMQAFFEEQLTKLRTDHLDFYLVHSLNRKSWDKMKELGIKEFLDGLKAQGKIKYAGFSFHDDYEAFEYIIRDYDWDMCQIQYNYMDTVGNAPGERGLRLAESLNIPVVIMEGLLGGKLAGVPNDVAEVFNSCRPGRSAAEWAFRWLCNDPAVCTVLSGVTTPEMTDDNLRIFDSACVGCMTDEELDTVRKARDVYSARIKVNCTACRYCMPCPAGVDIPRVFAAWNNAYKYDTKSDVQWTYGRLLADKTAADACIKCGKCEKICPQHISIREMLAAAHADLV